jgi:hypothetical protein
MSKSLSSHVLVRSVFQLKERMIVSVEVNVCALCKTSSALLCYVEYSISGHTRPQTNLIHEFLVIRKITSH